MLKDDGDPYLVFTPYSRRWRALAQPDVDSLLPSPDAIPTPDGIESDPIPDEPVLPDSVPFTPGEAAALARLAAFVEGDGAPVFTYRETRNRVDLNGTSGLSPYLRWGMLSPRRAVAAAYDAIQRAPGKEAEKSAQTWLDELIWREFYVSILVHYPRVLGANFREKYDAVRWRVDDAGLQAWQDGKTGYPLVDAAMRALKAEGWLHNRARMVVASFLTKDLLIDWQAGERWFMQHLVDGDPAPNNGGWQWTAGTGTDAAPYFRIFNPTSQARKHDPDGAYIRQWVPELADVPDTHIHEPWEMDDDAQKAAGCIIGEDYPAPIVDHAEARERTLEAYGEA